MKKHIQAVIACSLLLVSLCPVTSTAWSLFDSEPGYTYELLGETYTVPFHISELLDNGWVSKYGDCTIEANGKRTLYLIYSETTEPEEGEEEPEFEVHTEAAGYVLTVELQNASSKSASYADCKVIGTIGSLHPLGVFVYEKIKPHYTLDDVIRMYDKPTSQIDSALYYFSDGNIIRNAKGPDKHVLISYSAKHDGNLTVTIHNDGK